MRLRTLLWVAVVVLAFAPGLRAQQVDVRLVTDEAEAGADCVALDQRVW